MYNGVTFNFGSSKVCSHTIFETCISYDKHIWIAATDYYVHPTGCFRRAASAVRHAWFLVISRKSIYPMFTKIGMGVYWVNSLHGIAFGEDSSIAN